MVSDDLAVRSETRASLGRPSAATRLRRATHALRSARCITVRVRRSECAARALSSIPGALPKMDARARRAQLDRRERGAGSRLPLVLRLEDVRHLRGAHERPRGAGLLGSGRARDDDRAAAQPAGRPRSGRRPRAVRTQGRGARALARAARRPIPAFPSRSRTRR